MSLLYRLCYFANLFFLLKAGKIPKRFRKSCLLHAACLIQPKVIKLKKNSLRFWDIEFLTFIIPWNLFSISVLGKPLNTDKHIKIPTLLSVYFFHNFIWKRKTIIFFSEGEDAFQARLRKSNCNLSLALLRSNTFYRK